MKKEIITKYLKPVPFILILIVFLYPTYPNLFTPGGDKSTYLKAISDFIDGKNPYEWTIITYSNQEKYLSDLGYAYLSGFLYLLSPLYVFSLYFKTDYDILSKLPVLIADLFIAFLIFRKIANKNYFTGLIAVGVWLLNPYFLTKGLYNHNDQIPVLFLLLSLIYLGKDDVKTGSFFALSVLFKTFALVLLPIYFLLIKNKKDFLVSALIIGLFFSFPFMRSFDDFYNYIYGSLFVHSGREIQGRPFLFYLSYWLDFEFIQTIPVRVYSSLAMFGSWAVVLLGFYFFKIKDKYILGTIAAFNFYLFTPVLNRTYLLWFLPVIIFGAFSISKLKKPYLFYLIIIPYFLLFYFYLKDWNLGFHEVIPF
jgi:hypothetical protein